MSVERANSGFLSFEAVDVLVRRSMTEGEYLSERQLATNHRAIRPDSLARVTNTIGLLIDLGVLRKVEEGLELAPKIRKTTKDQLRRMLARRFLRYISNHEVMPALAASLQYDAEKNGIWADQLTIPGSREHVPFLLLQFGIFSRKKLSDRLWQLSPEYSASFLEIARRFNSERKGRARVTKDQLDARLARQEERGKKAEKWVVEFEKERLSHHPFVNQVERISDQDVTAGFDILSFSGPRSLRFDRFIEVKSYAGAPAFYWSENEISCARELGERYYLYILDSSRLWQRGYKPTIIPGPYSYFFELESPTWSRKCTETRFNIVVQE